MKVQDAVKLSLTHFPTVKIRRSVWPCPFSMEPSISISSGLEVSTDEVSVLMESSGSDTGLKFLQSLKTNSFRWAVFDLYSFDQRLYVNWLPPLEDLIADDWVLVA